MVLVGCRESGPGTMGRTFHGGGQGTREGLLVSVEGQFPSREDTWTGEGTAGCHLDLESLVCSVTSSHLEQPFASVQSQPQWQDPSLSFFSFNGYPEGLHGGLAEPHSTLKWELRLTFA